MKKKLKEKQDKIVKSLSSGISHILLRVVLQFPRLHFSINAAEMLRDV